MDSRTRHAFRTQPTIPTAPPVSSLTVPLEPLASADSEGFFQYWYGLLGDMLLPEERPAPMDDTSQSTDAMFPSTDGYGPLGQMDIPKDARLDGQLEYVNERLVYTALTDGGEVRYKVRWFGYNSEDDTCLLRSDIPCNVVAGYWCNTDHTEHGLNEGVSPATKLYSRVPSPSPSSGSLATGHSAQETAFRLPPHLLAKTQFLPRVVGTMCDWDCI